VSGDVARLVVEAMNLAQQETVRAEAPEHGAPAAGAEIDGEMKW
jgi:hypothetical protein